MMYGIEVGKTYGIKGSEATIRVVHHEVGSKVDYVVVDPPPPLQNGQLPLMNVSEPEFLNMMTDPPAKKE